MKTVSLVTLRGTPQLPQRATSGSLGYDLSTLEQVAIPAGKVVVAPCGIALGQHLHTYADGAGVAMLILPRSSLPLKYGLMVPNSPGLVDTDYSGEIGVLLYNFTELMVVVPTNTRIAQAVFVRCELPELHFVNEQNPTMNRGGFGSTGT